MDRDRDKNEKKTPQHEGSEKSGKGSQSTQGGRENPRDSQGHFTGGKSSQGSQGSQGGKGSTGSKKDEEE
jgi:hypothetical protein